MPGLLRKAIGGAMQGIGQGIVEENKQKGVMLREERLANLKHGYRTTEIAQANTLATNRAGILSKGNIDLEKTRQTNRLAVTAQSDADARARTKEQNAVVEARAVGAPFAGRGGKMYVKTGAGKPIALIGADGKDILVPLTGQVTEKDWLKAETNILAGLQKANAVSMGDKTESQMMQEASAGVSAMRMARRQGGTAKTQEAKAPLPMPKSKAELVAGRTYKTTKYGDMEFLRLKEDGTPQWKNPGGNKVTRATDKEVTVKQGQQPDLPSKRNSAAPTPVKASGNQQVFLDPLVKPTADQIESAYILAEQGDKEADYALKSWGMRGWLPRDG